MPYLLDLLHDCGERCVLTSLGPRETDYFQKSPQETEPQGGQIFPSHGSQEAMIGLSLKRNKNKTLKRTYYAREVKR